MTSTPRRRASVCGWDPTPPPAQDSPPGRRLQPARVVPPPLQSGAADRGVGGNTGPGDRGDRPPGPPPAPRGGGCLHSRPLINLKDAPQIETMRTIAEAVGELVMEFGGAMSGEHGDGLVRGWFLERYFGPMIYPAFHAIKRA